MTGKESTVAFHKVFLHYVVDGLIFSTTMWFVFPVHVIMVGNLAGRSLAHPLLHLSGHTTELFQDGGTAGLC